MSDHGHADNPDELYALASLAGVATEYYDIKGNLHHPPADTIKSILISMGYPDTPAALNELKGRPFNLLIEPVLAVYDDEQPSAIAIHFPCEAEHETHVRITMTLKDEDGTELAQDTITGVTAIAEAAVNETRHIRVELPNTHRPCGYYTIKVSVSAQGYSAEETMLMIVAPRRCHLPKHRTWGITLSLYSLRSKTNWGIGDLGDLKKVMNMAHDLGAGYVGISPLHAIANTLPQSISPYQPISRLYMNHIYADHSMLKTDDKETAASRDAKLVGYDKASSLKTAALRSAFDEFYPHAEADKGFSKYCEDEGAHLDRFAAFMALDEWFKEKGLAGTYLEGWRAWPPEYHDPDSGAVKDFMASHAKDITFYKYIQWTLDSQLAVLNDMGMPLFRRH